MAGRIGYYGGIVTDSLNFLLDAAKKDSYSGTGTVSRDLTIRLSDSTLFNGVSFSSDGYGTWIFDGNNDYISLPTNIYTQDNSDFSVTLWFNSTGTAGGTLFGQQNNNDPSNSSAFAPAIYLGTTGLVRSEVFWTNSASNAFISTVSYNDGLWHQVCVTYANGTQSTYIDGVLAGKLTGNNQVSYASTYYYFLGAGYAASRGLGANFFNGSISYFSFHNRLLNEIEIVQNYTSLLSRNPYHLDFSARAFLNITGVTNSTIVSAINTLVLELKAANLWYKMKAVYPFVGGSSTLHRWNLRDPRDSNDAFRLTFSGGMTHSSTGVNFGGVNGSANTFLASATSLTANNNHISLYSRTSTARDAFSTDIGAGPNTSTQLIGMAIRRSNNSSSYGANSVSPSSGIVSTTVTNGSGFFLGSITSSTSRTYYRNSVSIGSLTSNDSQLLSTFSLTIGGFNSGGTVGLFANFECAFATIGDGLNSNEASSLYTIIQKFQTTLGRQV